MKSNDTGATIKKVLIIGGYGQLGSDLALKLPSMMEVLRYHHEDFDITNPHMVRDIIVAQKPDVVINCAAYNLVEESERNPVSAYEVNAFGPYYVALACKDIGALCVHVSTDYVFDGTRTSFDEKDLPHPINVYGASKYAGETLVQIATPAYYIVRTSALFGVAEGSKKNFVQVMLRLAREGKDIRVVDDQITAPTFTLDLAEKIIEILVRRIPYGVYHVTNQGQTSWYKFAQEIFRQAKLSPHIVPIPTKESGSKIRRPRMSVLANTALRDQGISLLPEWGDALRRYLDIIV